MGSLCHYMSYGMESVISHWWQTGQFNLDFKPMTAPLLPGESKIQFGQLLQIIELSTLN